MGWSSNPTPFSVELPPLRLRSNRQVGDAVAAKVSKLDVNLPS